MGRLNRQIVKNVEKEEEEREEVGCVHVSLLGVAPQTEDRCAASLLWECLSICLSVKGCMSHTGRHRSVLFIHGVGAAQETANRSFPGKKARGDPCSSIGGNEPRGCGPDGDYFQSGGPEVGPPTGNMTFYIYITCTLRYLAYQEWLSTRKHTVRDWPRLQSINGKKWMVQSIDTFPVNPKWCLD